MKPIGMLYTPGCPDLQRSEWSCRQYLAKLIGTISLKNKKQRCLAEGFGVQEIEVAFSLPKRDLLAY